MQTSQTDLTAETRKPCAVADPLNPRDMLPYLSSAKLVPEEERENEREYRSWGEYMSSSTNSLDQFTKTYQTKKSSRRKSKASPSPLEDHSVDSATKVQVEPAVPTQ